MKKKFISLFFLVFFWSLFLSQADAFIKQLTDNGYADTNPKINDYGYVVWSGSDGEDEEIYLYNGTSVVQLTDNIYDDLSPQINNSGYVVWAARTDTTSYDEIFLYDGVTTKQLTNNNYPDAGPMINDRGEVVWSGEEATDSEIFFYNGSTVTQITNNTDDDVGAWINNDGYIVWSRYIRDIGNLDVFLYDGMTEKNLSNSTAINEYGPNINDNGDVVWWGNDGTDSEIYLYDGAAVKQLTNNTDHDYWPYISNNGSVVWQGEGGVNTYDVFLYDGEDIRQLSEGYAVHPLINDNYVVWSGVGGSSKEIFLYDGNNIQQITNDSYPNSNISPVVNKKGAVAWYAGGSYNDFEVYLYENTSLAISPLSGATYVTTQRFDLALIIKEQGLSVTGVAGTLDGSDISGTLSSCLVPGTLASGSGVTLRCPDVSGAFLGVGFHTLDVTVDLSDGTRVSDTVGWNVLGNTEP